VKYDPLPPISEKTFQAHVRELAEPLGWTALATWKSLHSPKGQPDLWLIRPPRFIAAELKKEGGQPSIDQATVLEQLSECPGVEAYLWRPSDWDEIVEVLT